MDVESFKIYARDLGFDSLESEIVLNDLCTGCGACSLVCPVNVIRMEEEPELIGKCVNCGLCLIHCPKSYIPEDMREKEILGKYKKVVSAKSKLEGQDGGVVRAILTYLFEKKEIDGAVVVERDENWNPVPTLITNVSDLEKSKGSKYSISPNLKALKRAKISKIAFVGVPCQLQALRKLKESSTGKEIYEKIVFVIGIFCLKNYRREMLDYLREEGIKVEKVKRFNIKGKYLYADSEKIRLKEIGKFVNPGCSYCYDFVGVFSDISVGASGSEDGWNTVFLRSEKGEKLFSEVKLETSKAKIEDIEKIAEKKRKNASKKIFVKTCEKIPYPFKDLLEVV